MSFDGLPPLREVIAELGLTAKRSLGQNFILDFNLTRRIARAAGPLKGRTVVEIGPGPGGLTRALLAEGAGRVLAIERDARCLPALRQIAEHYPGRLELIMGDALEVDAAGLAGRPAMVVANLPYSIATPLLIGWLSAEPWPPWYESLTLMFQREVAERIVAVPGTPAYGRLSVIAQCRSRAQIALQVPAAAFTPVPKVASALVRIEPVADELGCSIATLEQVTAASFGQRRKMLRSSLRQIVADPEALLSAAGIDPALRAEQLGVADLVRLARGFAQSRRRP